MHNVDTLPEELLFRMCGHQTLSALVQIRDNLVHSLISELSYNRILLNTCFASAPLAVSSTSRSRSEGGKEEGVSRRPYITSRKNRKIVRRTLGDRSRANCLKNDTKNIPKNYGKAILSFISKSSMTGKVASRYGLNSGDFVAQIRKMKHQINSIEGLRKMWGSGQLENKVKKCIRILSYQFMRKHCLRYIFYSKVRNFSTHIKYRQKLIEGVANPAAFTHIKDY